MLDMAENLTGKVFLTVSWKLLPSNIHPQGLPSRLSLCTIKISLAGNHYLSREVKGYISL